VTAKVDPDLVDFLRRHLKTFGEEALRAKLLDEGVAEADIGRALAAARKPARRRLPWGPVLLAAAAVGGGAWLMTDDEAPSQSPRAPAQAPVPLKPGETEPQKVQHGKSGFLVKLPPGYEAQMEVREGLRPVEIMRILPRGKDAALFADEKLYGPLGLYRLEALPRRVAEGRPGLEALRRNALAGLTARKAEHASRQLDVGGLPAFLVSVRDPFPLVQAFVLGEKSLFVLTGGTEDERFTAILMSLHETPATRAAP
jgi:hypothetical protein